MMSSCDRVEVLEATSTIFVRRRRMQFLSFVLNTFFLGIQYSIILPSAWQYLKGLGAPSFFYAAVISGVPIGTIVTLPIVGSVYDRTRKTRKILTALNLFGMIGSFIYALPYSPWLPLLGRCLVGVTASVFPVHQGEVTYVTKPEQRLGAFAVISFAIFIGLLLGPLISLVLENINIDLGSWHIDNQNSPGLFMVFIWMLMQAVTSFMVFDLANDIEKYLPVDEEKRHLLEHKSYDLITSEEQSSINVKEYESDEVTISTRESVPPDQSSFTGLLETLREAFSPEILTVIFISFVGWLFMFETETVVPLFTQEDFAWGIVETNLVYALVAVVVLIVYLLIMLFGKKMEEIALLFIVLILAGFSATFLLCYSMMKTSIGGKILFFLALTLYGITEPLNNTGTKALISKTTAPNMQGMMSSYLIIAMKLAQLSGPFYGTLVFKNTLAVSLFSVEITVFGCLFFLLVISKLRYRLVKYQVHGNSSSA